MIDTAFIRSFDTEWWRVTLLGEPIMMMPVAVIIFVWLWRACGRPLALAWGAALALGVGLLIAQKLLYYVGGVSLTSVRLYTMSGHSLAASFIYGSLGAIIARPWRRNQRFLAYAATTLLVLAIAVSRVAVAHHRPSEAISGLALGAILLAYFLRYHWARSSPSLPNWMLWLPCLAMIGLTYGHVFEFENIFRWLGRWARPGASFYH